jgi:acetyl-CoA carboxylase carboxyl transferase subunit beta
MARDDQTDQTPKTKGAGWLSKLRPGVRKADAPRPVDTPDDLWVKCPDTGELIYRADLDAAFWVTPSGFHMRIGPAQRFRYTFDDGAFERIAAPLAPDDPLGFSDQKPYKDRLAAARKATGEKDAMAIAFGRIRTVPAVVLVQDFAFLGGSLGMSAGEGFIGAARAAVSAVASTTP